MQDLRPEYIERMEQIAAAIQDSEEYAQFMETEEEAEYKLLQDAYEPHISRLHTEVAANDPLQLISFETILLNPVFEGLFLPKTLGYSVLRGQLNGQHKYIHPQNHFRDILIAICESSNIEFIKKRIGQTVQMGFALSSDIWITDLINSVANKRIRYYLQSNKLDRYRELKERQDGYTKYSKQFAKENFHTADFPVTFSEMKVEFPALRSFLMHRIAKNMDNSSLNEHIVAFASNPELKNTTENVEILCLAINFFNLTAAETSTIKTIFNTIRKSESNFVDTYFTFLLEAHNAQMPLGAEAEMKASTFIDKTIKDEITEYYALTDHIHTNGYATQEVMDAVKAFYDTHEGLSKVNECIRWVVYNYLHNTITGLSASAYHEFFELSKIFTSYIHIFGNQQFNLKLAGISLNYIKRLMDFYLDKRGRDYQDIKKFVASTLVDLRFIHEKEVVEMFKSRRKKKGEA
jgi:hypothetical protein